MYYFERILTKMNAMEASETGTSTRLQPWCWNPWSHRHWPVHKSFLAGQHLRAQCKHELGIMCLSSQAPLASSNPCFPGQSNIPIFYICGEAKILFYSLERKQLNVVNTANSSMNRNCYQQRASEKCALDRNISNESTGFPQVVFSILNVHEQFL